MPTSTGIFTSEDVKDFGYRPTHEIISDFLAEFFVPTEPVIGIGAAMGYFSRCLTERGFQCIAIDGSQAAADGGWFPIQVHDLSKPCRLLKGQVLCLEVGEHIPSEFEKVFLHNLFQPAQHRMVLSWALVGQGGQGHVNCRDNFWVIERLRAAGWHVDVEASERAKRRLRLLAVVQAIDPLFCPRMTKNRTFFTKERIDRHRTANPKSRVEILF